MSGSPDPLKNVLAIMPSDPQLCSSVRAPLRTAPSIRSIDYDACIRDLGIPGTVEMILRTVSERDISAVFITFFGDSYHLPLEALLRIREKAALVVWAYDDDLYFDVHGKYYAQAAHAVVTTDYFSLASYRRLGIPAVFHVGAISKEAIHPVQAAKDIDVSFVGDCRKSDRLEQLRFLEGRGLEVEYFGAGSPRGKVSSEEMCSIFSRSRISLNFTKLDDLSWINGDDPILNRTRQGKARPVELAMARSFCLSEYAPSLPVLFDVGREIDCFQDKESLLEKVRFHLDRAEEREAMAERAYRRALAEYEEEPQMRRIFGELRALLSSGAPAPATCYRSPRFQQRQVNVLFVYCLASLGRGNVRFALETLPSLFQYGLGTLLAGCAKGLFRASALVCRRLFGPDSR